MKKILILIITLLLSVTALAFGGGDSGRKATYEPGLVAVGVHFGGDKQASFATCVGDEELVGTKCLKKCAEGVMRDRNGVCTVCSNKNEMYLEYMGGCTAVDTTNLQCRSNADCLTTQYCKIMGYSSYIPTNSLCQPLDTIAKDMQVMNVSGVGKKHMIRSTKHMHWDAARNWCLARGGRMASLTDFGITDCNSSSKALEKCASTAVGVIMDGMVSQAVKDNWAELGTGYSWMKESYNDNAMYLYAPSSGDVLDITRYDFTDAGYALCVLE